MTARIVDICDPARRTTSCVSVSKAHEITPQYLNRNDNSTSTFRAFRMFGTSVWAHIQYNYRQWFLGNTHSKWENSAILLSISIIYRISFACWGSRSEAGVRNVFFAPEINATTIFRCSHSANLIIDCVRIWYAIAREKCMGSACGCAIPTQHWSARYIRHLQQTVETTLTRLFLYLLHFRLSTRCRSLAHTHIHHAECSGRFNNVTKKHLILCVCVCVRLSFRTVYKFRNHKLNILSIFCHYCDQPCSHPLLDTRVMYSERKASDDRMNFQWTTDEIFTFPLPDRLFISCVIFHIKLSVFSLFRLRSQMKNVKSPTRLSLSPLTSQQQQQSQNF